MPGSYWNSKVQQTSKNNKHRATRRNLQSKCFGINAWLHRQIGQLYQKDGPKRRCHCCVVRSAIDQSPWADSNETLLFSFNKSRKSNARGVDVDVADILPSRQTVTNWVKETAANPSLILWKAQMEITYLSFLTGSHENVLLSHWGDNLCSTNPLFHALSASNWVLMYHKSWTMATI